MATYNIPLRSKVIRVQRYRRAKKAVSVVRAFVERHQKSTRVKLGEYLNKALWKQGIKNFPRVVRVVAEKDEKGIVDVELLGAPREKSKGAEKTIETVAGEKKEEKTEELPSSKEKLKKEEVESDAQKSEPSEKKPQGQEKQQKERQPQKIQTSEKQQKEQAKEDSNSKKDVKE